MTSMTNIRGTHNIVVVESGQGIAAALICSLCWNIMHHIHNAIKCIIITNWKQSLQIGFLDQF